MEAHDDHFAQDELDVSWIPDIAKRGWVILTKDKNIRRPGPERDAVMQANARVITLTSGNMRGEVMAALFVQHITEMEQLATSQPAPDLVPALKLPPWMRPRSGEHSQRIAPGGQSSSFPASSSAPACRRTAWPGRSCARET